MDAMESLKNEIAAQTRSVLKLPENCRIDVNAIATPEGAGAGAATEIVIHIGRSRKAVFTIEKSVGAVSTQDISDVRDRAKAAALSSHPVMSRLFRLFGWWVIFAGSFTLFSVCPVCGQVGCPIGVGIIGIVAGVLAVMKMYLKDFCAVVTRAVSGVFSGRRIPEK